MRVLQLGPYPPPHGGVQTNLVAIRNFLRMQGVPCAVINITRHRQSNADEVYYPKNAAQLLRLLLQLKYDVIHLHLGGMLTRRLLALGLVCTLTPAKSVMTFHSGGFPSTPDGKALGPNSFAGFVLRRFDGLIGVNHEITDFFGRLSVQPEKTRLIYPHAFLPQEQPTSTLSEPMAFFLAAHQPVLISVGLLEPEYDLPLQIEALGQVRQKFPSAGLALIGSGSLEQDLRGLIQRQPWAEHILLCGDVPHAVTMRAIASSRLMLRTTLYDGDAVSVREALYLGTPVIATDNGMRPPGVRLLPKRGMAELVAIIGKELEGPEPSRSPAAGCDDRNVRSVFDFYNQLFAESTT